MSDSYLDHIPSKEREKIRKRMRSPEAYEKLREKVKGPEDLERELEHGEKMAEVGFALETEPRAQERLKNAVEQDLKEQGIEEILEKTPDPETRKTLEKGKFRLAVSSHPSTHADQIMIVPEGTVQEKLPVKTTHSERYAGMLQKGE
ncbi:MAG: hypothetical protein PHW10_00105 [Candidatus Peribacteraceae bacterium]|nr:hypothetical protein [Candidatus Peribacteraceae bacterium]